jgi:hypothetical protein
LQKKPSQLSIKRIDVPQLKKRSSDDRKSHILQVRRLCLSLMSPVSRSIIEAHTWDESWYRLWCSHCRTGDVYVCGLSDPAMPARSLWWEVRIINLQLRGMSYSPRSILLLNWKRRTGFKKLTGDEQRRLTSRRFHLFKGRVIDIPISAPTRSCIILFTFDFQCPISASL